MDNSKDLITWERGAPAPQCLSELLERRSGAGAPRSRERRTSFFQDLVSYSSGMDGVLELFLVEFLLNRLNLLQCDGFA